MLQNVPPLRQPWNEDSRYRDAEGAEQFLTICLPVSSGFAFRLLRTSFLTENSLFS